MKYLSLEFARPCRSPQQFRYWWRPCSVCGTSCGRPTNRSWHLRRWWCCCSKSTSVHCVPKISVLEKQKLFIVQFYNCNEENVLLAQASASGRDSNLPPSLTSLPFPFPASADLASATLPSMTLGGIVVCSIILGGMVLGSIILGGMVGLASLPSNTLGRQVTKVTARKASSKSWRNILRTQMTLSTRPMKFFFSFSLIYKLLTLVAPGELLFPLLVVPNCCHYLPPASYITGRPSRGLPLLSLSLSLARSLEENARERRCSWAWKTQEEEDE